jgi:hypothetical protein
MATSSPATLVEEELSVSYGFESGRIDNRRADIHARFGRGAPSIVDLYRNSAKIDYFRQ